MPRADDAPRKRSSACLHCRRQKLKCDGGPEKPCTRCVDDGVECVVRPRANAAILTDDLRWQQSVETRLQALAREVEALRRENTELRGVSASGAPRDAPALASNDHELENENVQHERTKHQEVTAVGESPPGSFAPLPTHLGTLRAILEPALLALEPLDASIDDATVLWEYFYGLLAIFHGFTASTELATPSPLLFTAVVTASAKRYPHYALRTPVGRWEELFQRALVRLMYMTVPKTWDDVVGLGIARTWFWKADEITAGLVYGAFVETSTPDRGDFRDRRVWDFLEMTTVSHGILHLSIPIVPATPPPGVPPRSASHVLLSALNELFDSLGHLNRAITSARSLVMTALIGQKGAPLSYAEVIVLRRCREDLEAWRPKWLSEIQNADAAKLPTGSSRDFLLDLVHLYYSVALLVIDGYLAQGPHPDGAFEASARALLVLVTEKWNASLLLWPKLFLHSALIAALALPVDDLLVSTAHDLFRALAPTLQTSGSRLLHRLTERLSGPPQPAFTPTDVPLPIYTGSDSFWADLIGVLGIPGEIVQQEQWPQRLDWGQEQG